MTHTHSDTRTFTSNTKSVTLTEEEGDNAELKPDNDDNN